MNQQIEQTMDALLNAVTIKPDGWMIALSIGAALLFAAIMWGAYLLANGAESYQPKFCGNFNCPCFDFYDFDGLDSIESGTFPWYAGFLVYRKIQNQY